MDIATKKLADYIKEKGIAITEISSTTKIPYIALWSSLSPSGTRDLRADEFLAVCLFLEKNPMDFISCFSSQAG